MRSELRWLSVKDFERGRSGSRPHVACEGTRESHKVRSDIAKGREGTQAAWPAEHGQAHEGQQQDASAAGTRLRSCARVRDKAARGQGPGRASNAAACGQARTSHRRCARAARRREERANAPPSSEQKSLRRERERRSYSGSQRPCPAPKGKVSCSITGETQRRRAPNLPNRKG